MDYTELITKIIDQKNVKCSTCEEALDLESIHRYHVAGCYQGQKYDEVLFNHKHIFDPKPSPVMIDSRTLNTVVSSRDFGLPFEIYNIDQDGQWVRINRHPFTCSSCGKMFNDHKPRMYGFKEYCDYCVDFCIVCNRMHPKQFIAETYPDKYYFRDGNGEWEKVYGKRACILCRVKTYRKFLDRKGVLQKPASTRLKEKIVYKMRKFWHESIHNHGMWC